MAANETPESEFSIECFQNYSAPEVFVQGLAGMVEQADVEAVIRAQKTMLQRFEKTTEMLTNCNALSANRLKLASVEFKRHTQLLLDMKKDLEYIFKKIRAMKTKLGTQYPDAYRTAVAASFANKKPLEEEDERPVPKKPESRMVLTVSTETLKPCVSETKKPKKRPDSDGRQLETVINDGAEGASVEKRKNNSSSSETESQDSSDETSTDTG